VNEFHYPRHDVPDESEGKNMSAANLIETHVQLKGVHLCCDGCVDALATAVASVPGVVFACDRGKGIVALSAWDEAAARQALDAIADAGLHGETGNPHLAMKTERNLPPGKVRKLKVSGIHNCCQPCYQAIAGAIETVPGVTGNTARPGSTTFEVTGNFSAAELVRALNRAGFHAKIEQA
jgi:mercuric ion binding protein